VDSRILLLLSTLYFLLFIYTIVPTMPKTATKKEYIAKKPVVKKADEAGFAVIATGGKQYKVSVGDRVKIEKILGEFAVGDSIVFDKVLLVESGASTTIGTPEVVGAKVTATLSKIARNQKVTVIKFKQKSRYFKKNGHRQPYFEVTINSIA